MHIHVAGPDGDAKFWMEPEIELAMAHGIASHQLTEIRKIIGEHEDELKSAWREHLGG